jgi:hypothetical protein
MVMVSTYQNPRLVGVPQHDDDAKDQIHEMSSASMSVSLFFALSILFSDTGLSNDYAA